METFIIRERSRVIFKDFRFVLVFIVYIVTLIDCYNSSYYTGSRGELTMAECHISLPKPFSGGDFKDWFQRFEICARANGWEAAIKAARLPTLLEGEASAIWLELSNEQQGDYKVAKEGIKKAMKPMGSVSLGNFHRRKLRSGEALSVFVHDLKKLIDQVIPNMTKEAKNLFYFINS